MPDTPIGTIRAPLRRARIVVPVLGLLERARRAACSLREDDQRVAFVEDPLGSPERIHVGRTTLDADDRIERDEPADDRPVERLLLAQPVDPPTERRGHHAPISGASAFEAWLATNRTGPSGPRIVVEAVQLDPGEEPPGDAAERVGRPDERADAILERRRGAA